MAGLLEAGQWGWQGARYRQGKWGQKGKMAGESENGNRPDGSCWGMVRAGERWQGSRSSKWWAARGQIRGREQLGARWMQQGPDVDRGSEGRLWGWVGFQTGNGVLVRGGVPDKGWGSRQRKGFRQGMEYQP